MVVITFFPKIKWCCSDGFMEAILYCLYIIENATPDFFFHPQGINYQSTAIFEFSTTKILLGISM
jgi:hypothetical protein